MAQSLWSRQFVCARSASRFWVGLADFAATAAAAYRRDVWAAQPRRVECWLEKDALSGIFADALDGYGVTLNVGRGYDGWSSKAIAHLPRNPRSQAS